MKKHFILHGAMFMALGVALGAVGSHAIQLSSDMQRLFELGVQYQIYHALGLLAVGLISGYLANTKGELAGWLMFAGIVGFSGGLYFYALTGNELIRKVIPLGGSLLIISWLVFFWAVLTSKVKQVD
ncbi:DUF423 domain-containing protein [Kangiella profundi]|uniref:DUF423 domain-containing protein n=1 Tax=Kangiella profundi TaxID=1561924 RepID=A0A2K9ALB4_9GAMM|nr:DUF423 domain-containing protein [Kangiella profundi]AUD79724.1 DUF423 domain-containing protein [Kangiella profundi]GGE95981.1 UPF0382 membrane protein [Kangiella profundi]